MFDFFVRELHLPSAPTHSDALDKRLALFMSPQTPPAVNAINTIANNTNNCVVNANNINNSNASIIGDSYDNSNDDDAATLLKKKRGRPSIK